MMMKKIISPVIASVIFTLLVSSCSGGGSTAEPTSEIGVPSMIEASPTGTATVTLTHNPTSTPTITATANDTAANYPPPAVPLTPGSVITRENATEIILLGIIDEQVYIPHKEGGLAWSPDGSLFVIASVNNGIRIINPYQMKDVGGIEIEEGFIPTHVDYSPDGKYIAAIITKKLEAKITIYDSKNTSLLRTMNAQMMDVYCMRYSKSGKWLTLGGSFGINYYDAVNLKNNQWIILDDDDEYVESFDYSRDDNIIIFSTLASGSEVWNLEIIARERYIPSEREVNLSRGGKYFAIGNEVFNAITMESILDTSAKDIDHWANAFGAGDEIIAIGSRDGKIDLWDITSRSKILSLEGDPDEENNFSFSPDGRLIASWGQNTPIRIWGIPRN